MAEIKERGWKEDKLFPQMKNATYHRNTLVGDQVVVVSFAGPDCTPELGVYLADTTTLLRKPIVEQPLLGLLPREIIQSIPQFYFGDSTGRLMNLVHNDVVKFMSELVNQVGDIELYLKTYIAV